jgi:hypothetical protein
MLVEMALVGFFEIVVIFVDTMGAMEMVVGGMVLNMVVLAGSHRASAGSLDYGLLHVHTSPTTCIGY